MTSVDSGSGSATTGTAESTATVVSLPPSTRSSQASVPRHSTGSRPHDACGNPSPNAGSEPAGYSSRWVCTSTIRSPGAPWSTVVAASSSIVDSGGSVNVPPGALDVERVVELEVGPDVEPPLVAGDGGRLRRRLLAAAGGEHRQRRRHAARAPQELAPRDAEPAGIHVRELERAPDRLGRDRRSRQRCVLAIRQRVEGERHNGIVGRRPSHRPMLRVPQGGVGSNLAPTL